VSSVDEGQYIARLLVSCPDRHGIVAVSGFPSEQGVARASHRQGVEELEQIGRDLERVVLGRAVEWHLQDRVLVHENRTVVF
jgi:formyltetrahydrofolate hydrolase